MPDVSTLEDLKQAGSGVAAPEAVARLYAEAFRRFGAQALWSRTPSAAPTVAQAVVVAEGLRREGGMAAWRLAADIEAACRAAV